MKLLLWNIALAMIWTAVTGSFSLANLALGFGLGYVVLWLVYRSAPAISYFSKMRLFLSFALFFMIELLRANARVAYDVMTRRVHMRPGVLAIPLEAETDAEITTLANLITLTPGTLTGSPYSIS
jgi:multicomponent Na+:H+ antiporter subunit E